MRCRIRIVTQVGFFLCGCRAFSPAFSMVTRGKPRGNRANKPSAPFWTMHVSRRAVNSSVVNNFHWIALKLVDRTSRSGEKCKTKLPRCEQGLKWKSKPDSAFLLPLLPHKKNILCLPIICHSIRNPMIPTNTHFSNILGISPNSAFFSSF